MFKISPWGKFLLLSILPIIIMSLLPVLVYFLALIWGAVFIISGFYLNRKQVFLLFAVNMLLFYLMGGIINTVFYLAFVGVPVLVMSFLASYAQGYYEIQKWGVLTGILCVSLFIGGLYMVTGDIGIKEMEQEFKIKWEESLKNYEENDFWEMYEKQGITKEKLEQEITRITRIVAKHLPSFYYLQAIMAAFFSLFLASFWSLKKGMGILQRKPFTEEVMPWQLTWLVILGLALLLIGDKSGNTSFLYYTGSNLLAVMFPISVYYGLSTLIYRIQHMPVRIRRWVIVFLLVMTLLLSFSILVFVALVGIFDALIDYRKLNKKKGDRI
ncbi:Predicted membrane protein [Thermosyntropha lipolytica DSM 11003]|uniref:Predicted membrane protein n=1 Tax=Thermosyntropha lipolytica DSM 11003 TaxID=1123382 RepID=A0A1M5R5E2_9FIRM|nr:DUF2232 domain-containing protein [Thermosyntropha lipolytica]SHH21585.1 Predicted membrane protein [Thermosyntropha lipolytica DSM 11003]